MNRALSPAEQQFLSVTWRAARGGNVSDRARIDRLARDRLGVPPDWDDTYPRLRREGLVRLGGDRYFLTAQGQACRERAERAYPFLAYMYDAYYARAVASQAHARFCEQVYGRDLCQHGLADMDQVDKLIAVLDVHEGQHLLDLGCGNGMIAEYISDATGAHVTGIDVSRVAIRQARERTLHKRGWLAFEANNLNVMELPEGAFDAVIAIDTLGFMDSESVVRHAGAALKPGGQIGGFHTQWRKEGDPQEILQPERTSLAAILRRCGVRFETWDLTAAEDAHWQRKLDVLATLRPVFEAEGNAWLYGFRQREAARYITKRAWENRSRHLYRVWRE